MSDDRKDEEAAKPHPSAGGPESAPPFVENDDSAEIIAIRAAQRHALLAGRAAIVRQEEPYFHPAPFVQAGLQGEGGLGADASVIGKTVRYVDFGFTSAREYWTEVAQPAYERFVNDQTRGNAIVACLALWPLHDWLWHEQHPGQDPRKSKKDYDQFRRQLFGNCPQLEWLRDAADGGKHRYLGRSNVQVREVAKTWPSNSLPLTFVLDDGSEHNLAYVLHRIVDYFRKTYFPG